MVESHRLVCGDSWRKGTASPQLVAMKTFLLEHLQCCLGSAAVRYQEGLGPRFDFVKELQYDSKSPEVP